MPFGPDGFETDIIPIFELDNMCLMHSSRDPFR